MDQNPEYKPVPGWEDYNVSHSGVVLGPMGFPLAVKSGQVKFCIRGRRAVFKVDELVAMCWSEPAATPPFPPAAALPTLPRQGLANPLAGSGIEFVLMQKTVERQKQEITMLNAKINKLTRQRDNLAVERLLRAVQKEPPCHK